MTPDVQVITTLEATVTVVPGGLQGLSGEYYGYNDNQASAINGFDGDRRVHTDDGTVGNLTSLAKVNQILAGRSAADGTFTAKTLEFGLPT